MEDASLVAAGPGVGFLFDSTNIGVDLSVGVGRALNVIKKPSVNDFAETVLAANLAIGKYWWLSGKTSLWSLDLFRSESIFLITHWIMVVMDQFSRRIIGFSVHAGIPDGEAVCRMLNRIICSNDRPKRLNTDNDPLFKWPIQGKSSHS